MKKSRDDLLVRVKSLLPLLPVIAHLFGCEGKDNASQIPIDAGVVDGATDGRGDGAAAEPLGPGGRPPSLGAQTSRAGRAKMWEVAIVGLGRTPEGQSALAETYLQKTPADAADFLAETTGMLGLLDSLDNYCQNQWLSAKTGDRYKQLAELLLDDRVYLDSTSADCSVYMGVELEALKKVNPGSGRCGGRTPRHDPIERLYSLTIGGYLTGYDDRISLDRRVPVSVTEFPFFGFPNP